MNSKETPGLILDARTPDNKIIVQQTSRPLDTAIYFTSQSDDTTDPTSVGGGDQLMNISHHIGDPLEQSLYIDFNIKENKTFLHEGYVMWKDASFDSVSMEVVPMVTKNAAGTSTNYNLYGGYLIIPAAGDGTLAVQDNDRVFVENPVNMDGTRDPGFWNADYSTETHTFSNITPAPAGNGIYNMFAVEVPLSRFVNRVLLLNNGFIMLQSAESSEMGQGMRVKLTLQTYNTDHAWSAACILTMHRARTC